MDCGNAGDRLSCIAGLRVRDCIDRIPVDVNIQLSEGNRDASFVRSAIVYWIDLRLRYMLGDSPVHRWNARAKLAELA